MLKNQVAVLGLGLTGLSTVNFLLQEGYRVTVFDTRAKPPSRDKLNKQVELITGELQGESLAQFSLVICRLVICRLIVAQPLSMTCKSSCLFGMGFANDFSLGFCLAPPC